MAKRKYVHCRVCGRHTSEVGPLSTRGLCYEDSESRLRENIEGMATMTGHVRDRWARGMILSAGGLLPERLQVRS